MAELTVWITAWIAAHSGAVLCVLAAYVVFLALVGSMPPVKDDAPYAARWAYGFLHLFAFNLYQAAALLPIKLPAFLKRPVSKPDNCDHTKKEV